MRQIQKHVAISPELWKEAEPLLELHGHTLTALVNSWLRLFVISRKKSGVKNGPS